MAHTTTSGQHAGLFRCPDGHRGDRMDARACRGCYMAALALAHEHARWEWYLDTFQGSRDAVRKIRRVPYRAIWESPRDPARERGMRLGQGMYGEFGITDRHGRVANCRTAFRPGIDTYRRTLPKAVRKPSVGGLARGEMAISNPERQTGIPGYVKPWYDGPTDDRPKPNPNPAKARKHRSRGELRRAAAAKRAKRNTPSAD